ncbi:ROK family protein [Kribbella qitaiheensis]|uniref:ROK family protein n=1 Tax=Kribbella qitaiheensis TaxID=1544730 RepID=A0A7G6WS54_9ACTN|nr:ROK family protein [Kribbella qitaiheensis]QNE16819.1 ROK family protein [Kribbella qitaiheensis]
MTRSPVVLGLDFGGTKIAVAVCDLSGRRLGVTTVESLAEAGAGAALARGLTAAHDLLAEVAPDGRLAAVGAATLGIPYDDRVELAPTFPGWGELPFGQLVRDAFPGVPVQLATDVKAAAAAELRWGALVDCDPGIYLNLGTGLAVAIVAGGTVISGAHGASGEIGYSLRAAADVWIDSTERTILEEVVSGQALEATGSGRLGLKVTAAEVFALAETKPEAAVLTAGFNRELAMHVVNLAIAIDPVRIVVGGGLAGSWDRIAPELRRALDAAVPFPPELTVARFPSDAPLVGALALGVQGRRRRPRRGGLRMIINSSSERQRR